MAEVPTCPRALQPLPSLQAARLLPPPLISRTGSLIGSRLLIALRQAPVVSAKLAVADHNREENQWLQRVSQRR